MSKKEDQAFADWVKETSAKLPETQRSKFEEFLAVDDGGAKEVFRGHLREADYYKRLNEMAEDRRQAEKALATDRAAFEQKANDLTRWYEDESPKNARLLKEKEDLQNRLTAAAQQLREIGFEDEANKVIRASERVDSMPNVSNEELESMRKRIANTESLIDKALPKLLGDFSTVIYKTASEKWNVEPQKVLDHSLTKGVSPIAAFEELTKDERAEREATAKAKLISDAKEEGRREAMSKLSSPDRTRPSGPTVIDFLRDPKSFSDSRTRVDAAVSRYLEQSAGNN